ncbi:MAG TPA: sigma factor-like helix-turn-helix DNA-binding protein [Actinomycetota bacterium]|nr:sigma factor-like helix-turn-helix DNA-binding protein [Actinomycetota bacterium]
MARLPPPLREPFVAIEVLGFSCREAAEVLGTNVGTLKSRMFRARAALVRLLEEGEGRDDA